MTDRDRVASLLALHRLRLQARPKRDDVVAARCMCGVVIAYTGPPYEKRAELRARIQRGWEEHRADALIAAGVTMPADVTTAEQLDALPFLTVIREVRQAGRDGVDYGGVYERRTSGWHCIAGTWKEPERNGPPSLPVRVLWQGTTPDGVEMGPSVEPCEHGTRKCRYCPKCDR